jgi:hypothetical protein
MCISVSTGALSECTRTCKCIYEQQEEEFQYEFTFGFGILTV